MRIIKPISIALNLMTKVSQFLKFYRIKNMKSIVPRSTVWCLISILSQFCMVQNSCFAISYIPVPTRAEIQEKCSKSEALVAEAFGLRMMQCQFTESGNVRPTHSDYLWCLKNLTGSFVSLSTRECRNIFALPLRSTLLENVKDDIQTISVAVEANLFQKDSLKNAIRHFNQWLLNTENSLYSKKVKKVTAFDYPQSVLAQDINDVISSYWRRVWDVLRSAPNLLRKKQFFTENLPILTQSIETALEEDLNAKLCFPIFEGALGLFNQRIELFSDLAEFSFELNRTQTRIETDSQIYLINKIIGYLNEPQTAFDRGSILLPRIGQPEITSFLTVLLRSSVKIQEVLSVSPMAGKKISEIAVNSVPEFSRSYLSILINLVNRALNFQDIVLQGEDHRKILDRGITKELIAKTPTTIQDTLTKLESSKVKFDSSRSDSAQKLIQDINQDTHRRQLEFQWNDDSFELQSLNSDLTGEKIRLSDEESLADQRMQSFLRLTESDPWKEKYSQFYRVSKHRELDARGGDARFDPRNPQTDITLIALNEMMDVKSGQTLVLTVNGSWSPSCALKKDGLPGGGRVGPEGYMVSETQGKLNVTSVSKNQMSRVFSSKQDTYGCENRLYSNTDKIESDVLSDLNQSSIVESSVSSKGSRNSEDRSYVNDQRFSVSAGFSIGLGDKVSLSSSVSRTLPGNVITNSRSTYNANDQSSAASSTQSQSHQKTQGSERRVGAQSADFLNNQNTDGSEASASSSESFNYSDEKRHSASFNLGYNSQNTPFPDMPAGSLLLVQLPHGNRDIRSALDIQVVRPHFVKLIHRNSDLYFVVNDCAERESSRRTFDNRLSITFEVKDSVGRLATDAMRILQEIFDGIAAKANSFLVAGEVSAVQLNDLEMSARRTFAERGGEIQEIPSLKELFDGWVSSEKVKLERKARILQLERRMRPVYNRLSRVSEDLGNLQRHQEVSKLSQIWSLNNLDLTNLSGELRFSLHNLKKSVFPVLRIRYPDQVLSELAIEHGSFIRSLNLETPVEVVNEEFRKLLNSLKNKVEQYSDKIKYDSAYIVLHFPKNNLVNDQASCSLGSLSCPIASELDSSAVWNSIRAASIPLEALRSPELISQNFQESIGLFEVRPENIYVSEGVRKSNNQGWLRRPVQRGGLFEEAAAPLVESMAIYFDVSSLDGGLLQDLMKSEFSRKVKIVSDMQFPFPAQKKMVSYQLSDGLSKFSVPVLFNNNSNPIETFKTSGWDSRNVGYGISPFGKFQIDFREFDLDRENSILRQMIDQSSDVALVMKVNYISIDQSNLYSNRR